MTEESVYRVGYDIQRPEPHIVSITAPLGSPQLKLDQLLQTSGLEPAASLLRIIDGPYHFPPSDPSRDGVATYYARLSPADNDRSELEIVRPIPGSKLLPVEPDGSTAEAGALLVGTMASHPSIDFTVDPAAKHILPRNVGVFGTVGSGKSNTTQVIIEEAARAGWAILVVDVEGEYTRMASATKLSPNQRPHPMRQPTGLDDVRVLMPASSRARKGADSFVVPIAGYSTELLGALMELTEAQRRMFHNVMEDVEDDHTLEDLIQAAREHQPYDGRSQISKDILLNRLGLLANSGLFDSRANRKISPPSIDEIAVAGRVSIVDVSEMTDQTRNLTLGYFLQAVFAHVDSHALGSKTPTGKRPPVMVVMEEVQTFFGSADETKRVVLDFLQDVARRGRKRWLSLLAVSQQPSSLPSQFFELLNTRVIHQTRSQPNIEALRRSCGDIDDSQWRRVTNLRAGTAIFSGPSQPNASLVKVRLASTQRNLTD